ncbi:unnamed protein product [Effrenium voratum]|uniref:Uncharacterized protein n=1 Tax=Effrenium voratum TaxID=2562239 RepID=A0AA36MP89_9DINO|nr:unnamed protein product [Effrenium voratum]CAJ1389584.1 unnamed protein product [Effrenium voratum]
MGSSSMSWRVLADTLQSCFGITFSLQTSFFTEFVSWKNKVCMEVITAAHGVRHKPQGWLATKDLVSEPHPPRCHIATLGIECDDISGCSSTPRSVLDSQGRSGQSFLQVLSYLDKVPFSERPQCLLLECVANLGKKRKSVQEKGTEAVADQLQERGYLGTGRS